MACGSGDEPMIERAGLCNESPIGVGRDAYDRPYDAILTGRCRPCPPHDVVVTESGPEAAAGRVGGWSPTPPWSTQQGPSLKRCNSEQRRRRDGKRELVLKGSWSGGSRLEGRTDRLAACGSGVPHRSHPPLRGTTSTPGHDRHGNRADPAAARPRGVADRRGPTEVAAPANACADRGQPGPTTHAAGQLGDRDGDQTVCLVAGKRAAETKAHSQPADSTQRPDMPPSGCAGRQEVPSPSVGIHHRHRSAPAHATCRRECV
jgi:hypothetical protein